MAEENRSSGYRRIQGALSNLKHILARSTIAAILERHGIEPVPERSLTLRQKPPQTYQYAAVLCFLLLMDNLVGLMDVPGQRICRWQLLLVFGILNVVCELLFWSEAVCPSHPSTRRE